MPSLSVPSVIVPSTALPEITTSPERLKVLQLYRPPPKAPVPATLFAVMLPPVISNLLVETPTRALYTPPPWPVSPPLPAVLPEMLPPDMAKVRMFHTPPPWLPAVLPAMEPPRRVNAAMLYTPPPWLPAVLP